MAARRNGALLSIWLSGLLNSCSRWSLDEIQPLDCSLALLSTTENHGPAPTANTTLMGIVKSSGFTPTERLLAELCERSFLKLWSYPNPFKDDGKELCDLLAVFENHVFIFFDRESRHLENPDKNTLITWERWKRAAIDNQLRTAHGADGYIRSGRAIFLDSALRTEFPISIDRGRMIVHKIIVAHGAKEACQNFSDDNVYGSLAVTYGELDGELSWPFHVELDRQRPAHVLDSHNLPIIFRELDTFFDLSSYFDAKIEAINRFDYLSYCGEEDLLAHYILNFDDSRNRHFIGIKRTDINGLMIGEGEWKDFSESAVYKRKKAADRASYLWDEIIQRTCQNALDGTLLGDSALLRGQSALHEMAKEPRFSRRALATAMIEAIRNFPETTEEIVRNVTFMPSFYEGKAYVFLQLKKTNISDYDNDYRPKRQALLNIACGAAKNRFRDLHTIVGIAIDAPKFTRRNAEDFILMDCREWPDERSLHYERANEGLNFFNTRSLVSRQVKVQEFPTASHGTSGAPSCVRIGRNDPCPCGSGRKYKKCCKRIAIG